jgi:hypothetical protein
MLTVDPVVAIKPDDHGRAESSRSAVAARDASASILLRKLYLLAKNLLDSSTSVLDGEEFKHE